MLNYNQRFFVIVHDAEIHTARHHNALNGLHGTVLAQNEAEQRKIDRLKGLKTYSEIKETGTRTPYKAFASQFCGNKQDGGITL